ncbi:MAG: ribosome maturation factor RimP [Actinobacteria bacterium]|nr:MAG: ribosome maturation factor RimP [Actinomycetota bacterium]
MATSSNESAGTNVIVTRISELVTPIVSDLGLDLYDLEFNSGVVRVVVDTKPGLLGEDGQPAGVDLEKIGVLTRLISKEFDHSEPVPGRYTLEVTSPGLERNLRLPRHFVREVNKVISVRLTAPLENSNERRVQGLLVSADDRQITVRNASDVEIAINYSMIDRARTVFEWKPTSKEEARHSKKKFATTTEAKAS